MAEYSEYQRRRSRTTREKKKKSGYGKKFLCQLIAAVTIFAAVYTPVLPASFKEAVKTALNHSIDTTHIAAAINRIFENAATDAFTENEENSNEDTEQSAKNL